MKLWRQLGALIGLALLELYRRKDLVVMLILTLVVMLPLALMTPFGVSGASRTLSEVALLLIWLFSSAVALGVGGRLLPPEFERRTIYPLLAKPVAVPVVVAGKYLGGVVAALSSLSCFYLAYALFIGLRQGLWFPPLFWQAFGLHALAVALMVALALLGSLLLSSAANMTLGALTVAGMLLWGQQLPLLAAAQPWPGRVILQALYALAPHFEFFDLRQRLIHEWSPVQWPVLLAVAGYALCYSLLALALGQQIFKRRL